MDKSMKELWFDHVAKTRKKLSKGKNTCTHRHAMTAASSTWPDMKSKIERKRAREAKRQIREAKKGNET